MPKFEELKFFIHDNKVEVENGSANPMWGSCTVEYAKQKARLY